MIRRRLLARGMAAAMLATLALGHGACGSDSELSFEASEGAPCRDCEECSSIVSSCVCRTCTQFAFDPARKELLACGSHGWEVHKQCPGGGSVACNDRHAYEIRCLDADGKPVL